MATLRLLLGTASLLAACAGPPLAGGGRTELQFAGSDLVRFRSDAQHTSERALRDQARAYCGGREAELLEASQEAGTVRTSTWRCKPPSGAGGAR